MEDKYIHLRIVSPSGILFEGDVIHVNFPGETGSFAVYHQHAPLISALRKGQIIYSGKEGKKSVGIESGFVEVSKNQITASVEV